jgi:hypothetical protein
MAHTTAEASMGLYKERYEVRWSDFHRGYCVYDGDDPDPVYVNDIATLADAECDRLNADDTLGWSPAPEYVPLRQHLRRVVPHPASG